MALRDNWEFTFDVFDVAAGAGRRRSFHAERLEYWSAEFAAAEADLRANGINLREAIVASRRGSVANTYAAQPIIDNEKLAKVNETQSKMREHRTYVEDLDRWIFAFSVCEKGVPLKLSIADVQYFWLAETDRQPSSPQSETYDRPE